MFWSLNKVLLLFKKKWNWIHCCFGYTQKNAFWSLYNELWATLMVFYREEILWIHNCFENCFWNWIWIKFITRSVSRLLRSYKCSMNKKFNWCLHCSKAICRTCITQIYIHFPIGLSYRSQRKSKCSIGTSVQPSKLRPFWRHHGD